MQVKRYIVRNRSQYYLQLLYLVIDKAFFEKKIEIEKYGEKSHVS